MNIPDFKVFLQKSEKGIDLDFSSCYNLFRMSYGRINGLGRLIAQNETKRAIAESGKDISASLVSVCQEVELTKRIELNTCSGIIKSPNVPAEIKKRMVDAAIKLKDKKQTHQTVIITTGIIAGAVVLAYGINMYFKYHYEKGA